MKFLLLALVYVAGCGSPPAVFTCGTDDQCTLDGVRGTCVKPENLCALPAGDCPSGLRYDKTAGDMAGKCVGLKPTDDAGVGNDGPVVGPGPTIASVSPSMGPTSGGLMLTITGTGFDPHATVTVAGVPSENVTAIGPGIMALLPKPPVGTVGVTTLKVTNPDGQSASKPFTYTATSVTFAAAPTSSAAKTPSKIVAGDFNADNHQDLVVYSGDGVLVYLGNGDGTFGAPKPTGQRGYPAVGYFNGDKKLDIVVVGGKATVLLGNGDGTFNALAAVDDGLYAAAPVVADFNHDGHSDVAVANTAAPGTDANGSVLILSGSEDGKLTPVSPAVAVDKNPTSLAVGDFNGDAKPDLVVANVSSNTVGVLLGAGDGSFLPHVPYPLAGSPWVVAVGDFDNDGKSDVIAGDQGSDGNYVGILLGAGNGTLKPESKFKLDPSPYGGHNLALADFDSDGKLDFVSDAGSGQVVGAAGIPVMLGKGGGMFDPGPRPIPGKEPGALSIADFNEDGKLDIAVANSGDISILINTSK